MGALLVLGGIAFIGLSLFLHFTPRLRVLVGLLVGGLLAGVVVTEVSHWLAMACDTVATPLGHLIGQRPHDVAVAIPSVIGFALAVIVAVFLRRGGGRGHASAGHGGGKGGGKGGRGGLGTVALVSAVLLPVVVGSLGDAIRSVSS